MTEIKLAQNEYLISIEAGEKLIETMASFCKSKNIEAAVFNGIGGITNIKYGTTTMEGYNKATADKFKVYELIFQGNISKIAESNEIKVHPHGTWYDSDFKGYGGHIFEADVAIVVEIYIKVYPGAQILRKPSIVAPHLMEIYKK